MRNLFALLVLSLFTLASAQSVGLSLSTLNNPFFVTLRDGAQAAADDAGYELIVTDAQDSVSTQISDIEDLVQRGVDALIINATDSDAVVPAVRSANDAGIPVIAVDRTVNGGDVAYFISSDNVAGGRLAAEFICNQLDSEGNVVELEGIPGASATRERGQGFNEYMNSECSSASIIASQTANFNRAEGLSVMENILVAQPDIGAVFAHNDEMALGALQAIEPSNRDMLVVGFDGTDDARQAVEECRLAATVAQRPDQLGQEAINVAGRAVGGEVPSETESIAVELELVTNTECEGVSAPSGSTGGGTGGN